jgi:GT2 family glycosyltransferase
MVTGLYIQRNETVNNLEIYINEERLLYKDIKNKGLIEINRCGFGCVLINSKVINAMEYPHFDYRPALNHDEAYSEDIYFCDKAIDLGFKIFADTSILCSHHGKHTFLVT